MMTARELADRVVEVRRAAWERSDPTVAVVATGQLNPDDERSVRRIVEASGFEGDQLEEMVRQVSARVVGQVEAQDDSMPVDGGD
jgi:hypothetical protein